MRLLLRLCFALALVGAIPAWAGQFTPGGYVVGTPPAVVAVAAPAAPNVAEVSFLGSVINIGSATAYTFTAVTTGAAASDRKIVVSAFSTNAAHAVSTITVAGVSATLVIAQTNALGDQIELWQADVPTGTSGDIVVTWAGAEVGMGIGVWRVVNAASAAYDTGGSAGVNPGTDTLDIPANGVGIGAAGVAAAGVPTWIWVGFTEDFDKGGVESDPSGSHSGSSDAFAAAQTGLTISATPSTAVIRNPPFAIASWGPAP